MRLTGYARELFLVLRGDAALYLLITLYIAFAWIAAAWGGVSDRFSVFVYPRTTIVIAFAFAGGAFVLYSLHVLLSVKPVSPGAYISKGIGRWVLSRQCLAGVILTVAFTFFFSAVSSFKTLIPAFQPFAWDHRFARLDVVLHGGSHPWQWLQWVLGYPWLTKLVNVFYSLWLVVMFAAFFWQVFAKRYPLLRKTFLVSFILCWWINGSVLAVLLSSAGPCFWGQLYPGSDPYAELMQYLHQTHDLVGLQAIPVQQWLWDYYQRDALGVGAGISAMPSMHVSVAWLIFLLARHCGRGLAWLSGGYVLLILLGSVHLGWHYAVDGYLSMVTTTLIWLGVAACYGKMVERSQGRESDPD